MFIYIFKAGKYTKIGVTGVSIDKRIKQLQTGCPHEIKKYFVGSCESMKHAMVLERNLHKRYKKGNTFGEWFILTDSHIRNIKKYIDENINDPYLRAKKSASYEISKMMGKRTGSRTIKRVIKDVFDRYNLVCSKNDLDYFVEKYDETKSIL